MILKQEAILLKAIHLRSQAILSRATHHKEVTLRRNPPTLPLAALPTRRLSRAAIPELRAATLPPLSQCMELELELEL